jgi:hypothetical protein
LVYSVILQHIGHQMLGKKGIHAHCAPFMGNDTTDPGR